MSAYRHKFIDMLAAASEHSHGTSFFLLMKRTVLGSGGNDFGIYPRIAQPCQGGETRMYSKTHPKECTQPHNSKPGDLYAPFPDGRPEAISFPMGGLENDESGDKVLRYIFSDNSPFIKGHGGSYNVRFLTKGKNKYAYGVVIGVNHLKVDPTIMISAINTYKSVRSGYFTKLLELGMPEDQALAALFLNGGSAGYIQQTNEYHFPAVFSARRYFEKKPHDLSGGYYCDRTDYNRTYVSDIWLGDVDKGGIIWSDAMEKASGKEHKTNSWGGFEPIVVTPEEFVKAATKVFADALTNEQEVVEEPYKYRDATGKELPHPLKAAIKKAA